MIYFDNAATTFPKPETVYKYTDEFYRNFGVSVGRGQHELGNIVGKMVWETKNLIKKLLICENKEIVFTSSATEGLNIVLQGLNWDFEQNVYITPFEHNSVLRVLAYLKEKYNIRIIELCVDKSTLTYDFEKIKCQFQKLKPNAVIMSHVSNMCGLIAPISELCNLAKDYDAVTVVDMAQTAGLVPTDLSKISSDYTVFAGHKTLYAPFGVGGIILDKKSDLKPFLYGGTGIDSININMPSTIPEKFEVGSQNTMAIAGLNAAVKWINEVGIDKIYHQEKNNTEALVNILNRYDNIKLVGYKNEESNIGVVSCLFDGFSSDDIGRILNENNVAVRTGLHCSPAAHKFFGTIPDGTVRFSLGYFNTKSDFQRLEAVLDIIELNS